MHTTFGANGAKNEPAVWGPGVFYRKYAQNRGILLENKKYAQSIIEEDCVRVGFKRAKSRAEMQYVDSLRSHVIYS